jgi:outer membrane biosynthesis protein TonB
LKLPVILRIFKGEKLIEVKQFDSEQIIFGHKSAVTVDLDDPAVSPIHCLIERRDNGYYVCDMGSATGTKKNGQTVLAEAISSGDNIEIGPFRINFFVGAPTPVSAGVVASPAKVPTPPKAPPVKANVPEQFEKTKTAVTATHELPSAPKLPANKKPSGAFAGSQFDKKKHDEGSTFAPPSEIQDLQSYLKPTKGPTVQVIVAWKERILATYHFTNEPGITIGSGNKATIYIPANFISVTTPFIELTGGCRVLATPEMEVKLLNSSKNTATLEELFKNGKAVKAGGGNAVRLDQGELLSLSMDGGTVQIYVRYVPHAAAPILGSPLDFSAGEFAGLVTSLMIVALLALYMSVYSPSEDEKEKPDETVRLAQFIYNKPPPKEPDPPPTPEVVVPPPQPPKVIKVVDKPKETPKGNPAKPAAVKQVEAAKAAEVRPKDTTSKRKVFTSVKQGGAVKIADKPSASAQSAKDVNKVGLLSAFGGGGVKKQLDQAYSGSGELLGMADRATGTSGQNEDRAGDDIGSRFKDTGAGGKGTATQGIAGIGTKGRGSGMSGYGSGSGLGGKGNVTIDAGGSDAGWEGTIDREAVRRVIRSILSQIKSCYERQLRMKPNLEGKIVVQFEIMSQGRVRSAKTKSTALNDGAVESCVANLIKDQRFPEPPPGTIALVDYPFVFGAQK